MSTSSTINITGSQVKGVKEIFVMSLQFVCAFKNSFKIKLERCCVKMSSIGWVWWHPPAVPALGGQSQRVWGQTGLHNKPHASQGCIGRLCLKRRRRRRGRGGGGGRGGGEEGEEEEYWQSPSQVKHKIFTRWTFIVNVCWHLVYTMNKMIKLALISEALLISVV